MDTIPFAGKTHYDVMKRNIDITNARGRYDSAKSGYKIIINFGCLSSCTFCNIRKATGALKSINPEIIIKQVEYAIKNNEITLMLLGGDAGAYGKDIGVSFPALLKGILKVKGQIDIYVHDYNMRWFIFDFHELCRSISFSDKQIKSMMLPVQSGSTKILKLMNRKYTIDDVLHYLSDFKKRFPKIDLGTHIMIGFPGETQKDFELTCKFLEVARFDFVSCYPFSEFENSDISKKLKRIDKPEIIDRITKMKDKFGDIIKVYN